jgi:hypothetical protein
MAADGSPILDGKIALVVTMRAACTAPPPTDEVVPTDAETGDPLTLSRLRLMSDDDVASYLARHPQSRAELAGLCARLGGLEDRAVNG